MSGPVSTEMGDCVWVQLRCRTFILLCNQLAIKANSAFNPSRVGKMSTSFSWEGKGKYGSFYQQMNTVCAGKTEIP